MKVAILGFGAQGRSAHEYWSTLGHETTVCDGDEAIELPSGLKSQLGPDHLKNLDQFDLIVRSPIVHPRDIIGANTSEILSKVTTVTNEFLRVCPTKNIIGVTGTKGKGTTSTLVTKMLEAAGKRVHLGGNIGTPPLDMLKEDIKADDWMVLELANFQLIDIKYSPKIAVCLMVVPEHLDWHHDNSEYLQAKQQLFRWQTPEDTAIYYALNPTSEHITSVSPGHKLPYMKYPGADVIDGKVVIGDQEICSASEIKLLGKHNWQNICAAVTCVWQITQNIEAIRSVISSFSGMEHRLEFVRELNSVKYYDDSFGTTPETAIVALQALHEPKIVIVGGSDKGASFVDLASAILENNVSALIAIGDTGPVIAGLVREKDEQIQIIEGLDKMEDVVAAARSQARPGNAVLLSTGCASFGLFKNYQDRGDQFKQAVLRLK